MQDLPYPPSNLASVLVVINRKLSGYPMVSVIHLLKIKLRCVKDRELLEATMREVIHMLMNPLSAIIGAAPGLIKLGTLLFSQ
ncbi:hypothetical protein NL676_012253 [Syzygium grande]|nr:hypothetical protein NL676_012253 [Syzygium grande]